MRTILIALSGLLIVYPLPHTEKDHLGTPGLRPYSRGRNSIARHQLRRTKNATGRNAWHCSRKERVGVAEAATVVRCEVPWCFRRGPSAGYDQSASRSEHRGSRVVQVRLAHCLAEGVRVLIPQRRNNERREEIRWQKSPSGQVEEGKIERAGSG